VGAPDDLVDLRALHVHARDEDDVGPGEVLARRGARVLVDEADLPGFGEIRGDRQEALRRHEGADPPTEERVSVLEGAERARIRRIDAENAAMIGRAIGRPHQAA
jgi:hypothetical protein